MRRLIAAIQIVAFFTAMAQASQPAMVVTRANAPVAETVDKLTAAIEKAGSKVFAVVDHAAGAKSVGAELEPTVLVIFGNPKVGTPVIQADRRAGLDLPARVLVWEEGGETKIGYQDPQALKAAYGGEGAAASLDKLSAALQKLTAAAAR